jgi:integrase
MDTKASGAFPEEHPLYAPGLKWRARIGGDVPYWMPPQKDIKKGYAPKSLTLDRNASQIEIAAACRRQWLDLENWRETRDRPKVERVTIGWLIDRYQNDKLSPYHRKTAATRKNYDWNCKRIRETIGDRRLDPKIENGQPMPRILGEDIRRWHFNWGKPVPALDENGQPIPGEENMVLSCPSQARHLIMMLRTLISYAIELGVPGSVELRSRLSAMTFPAPAARQKAPTYPQVDAIVRKAEEMDLRSIAITTLAQFELMERRVHIIGQYEGDVWKPGWVWENVSFDWWIRYYQTKTVKTLREFDLKVIQRLLQLMQKTPKEDRKGPIIICERTGKPWTRRYYAEMFREVARAAGVPDDVWSMDMRAAGGTEADDIPDITPRMLQDGLGHADLDTQEIYRRGKQRNAQKVVEFRQKARKE